MVTLVHIPIDSVQEHQITLGRDVIINNTKGDQHHQHCSAAPLIPNQVMANLTDRKSEKGVATNLGEVDYDVEVADEALLDAGRGGGGTAAI